MEYCNGDAFEGEWVSDKRHGSGKYFYANGDVFVGTFIRDAREGLGTIYMVRILFTMTLQSCSVADTLAAV